MEEAVTLVQVQQVVDAAAASATAGLEERFEAMFEANFDAIGHQSMHQMPRHAGGQQH